MRWKEWTRMLTWGWQSLGPDTFTRARARYFSGVVLRLFSGYDAYRLESCRRVDEGDERPCWELTLIGPRGRVHEAGDSLLLGWENDPDEVEALIEALGAEGDQAHRFRGAPVPLARRRLVRAPLRELLTRHIEIRRPSPALARLLGLPSETPSEASPHGGHARPSHRVVDVIKGRPGLIDAQTFLGLQGGAPGRLYVLSRVERRSGGDRVSVLIREATEPFLTPSLQAEYRLGRASRSVAAWSQASAGLVVPATALKHPFRIDAGPGHNPQILAVTGTGIASVAVALRSGKLPRGSWLVYGVRTWSTDALEPDLLLRALTDGTLARIDVALSRPGTASLPHHANLTFHVGLRVPGVFGLHETEARRRLDRGDRVYACGHSGLGSDLERLFVPWVGGPEVWKAGRESRRFQLSVS